MTVKPAPFVIAFVTTLLIAIASDPMVAAAVQSESAGLRSLGQRLSILGDSGWMAIVLVVWALLAAFVSRSAPSPVLRRQADLLLTLAVVLFLGILLSGIAVQILKHLIGRARPVHFTDLGPYSFHPLAFASSLNSFPSGHSTTIGAVAAMGFWLVRRLWPAWLVLALLVGVARVLAGAHYPSDVVAGLTLGALVSFAMLRSLVARGTIPPRHSRRWSAACRALSRKGLSGALEASARLTKFRTLPGIIALVTQRFWALLRLTLNFSNFRVRRVRT